MGKLTEGVSAIKAPTINKTRGKKRRSLSASPPRKQQQERKGKLQIERF
jgi:hypothetical protein